MKAYSVPHVVVAVALVLVLGTLTIAGCTPHRPRETKPQPPKPRGPIVVDWSDPGSVVEGFFDAKKRGDWQQAFNCCDFVERLGADEAQKIREAWRKDSMNWPNEYRDMTWVITGETSDGDYALVSVLSFCTGLASMDEEGTGFQELCKRYGDQWKITEFKVPPKHQVR